MRDAFYAQVALETHRSDLTGLIPGWAEEVEQEINRDVRVPQMLARTTIAVTDDYADVPDDWLAVRSFRVNDQIVTYAAQEDMDRPNQAIGQPLSYGIIGTQFRFFPPPSGTMSGDLTYYAKVPPLATNTTNWLLSDHREIYRCGILQRAMAYTLDEAREAKWRQAFLSAVRSLEAPLQPGRVNSKARPF